jgi:hypothetical protein
MFRGFFQLGYVARDLDAAIDAFRHRVQPASFQITNAVEPYIHIKRIALTWIDLTMIELIEPNADVPSIYIDSLPVRQEDIRLHHLGFLTNDYADTLQRLTADGYALPMSMSYGEVLDCCYADAREQLGHYLEYIRLGEEGRKWFSAIPGFRSMPST